MMTMTIDRSAPLSRASVEVFAPLSRASAERSCGSDKPNKGYVVDATRSIRGYVELLLLTFLMILLVPTS